MALEAAPEIARYEDVPVYRRRWCYTLLLLLLTPIGILVAVSGEVYAVHDGAVKRIPASSRYLSALGFGILILNNVVRAAS